VRCKRTRRRRSLRLSMTSVRATIHSSMLLPNASHHTHIFIATIIIFVRPIVPPPAVLYCAVLTYSLPPSPRETFPFTLAGRHLGQLPLVPTP
jgi:hypothetical protein